MHELSPEYFKDGGRHLNFSDPGPIPENLLHVPGFIEGLAGYTLATGHSPNRILAFTGALAMLAHLSGRVYCDRHGTQTNLYIVVLGESGIGKDDPRKTNVRLASQIGMEHTLAESFASGEAMEDELIKCPSILLQSDEVAAFFGSMRGGGKAAKSMSERMRRLFTSSSSSYVIRSKANEGGEAKTIYYPHLTLFGTGVPDEFLDAITPREIRDGLFGRCIILKAEDEYCAQAGMRYEEFPQDLLDAAKEMGRKSRFAKNLTGDFRLLHVLETPEATGLLDQSRVAFTKLKKAFADNGQPYARALVVRMSEKVSKLAMLWAISESPLRPRVTKAAVEWAIYFTAYVTKWMLYESQFHLAEGKFGKMKERAKAIMSKNGGSIDKRKLLRTLHCDEAMLRRLVKTMLVAEEIDSPSIIDGKVVYTLTNDEL